MLKITNSIINTSQHNTFKARENNVNKQTQNTTSAIILVPLVALSMLPGLNGCSKIEILDKDTFELQDSLSRKENPEDPSGLDIKVDTTYNEVHHEIVL